MATSQRTVCLAISVVTVCSVCTCLYFMDSLRNLQAKLLFPAQSVCVCPAQPEASATSTSSQQQQQPTKQNIKKAYEVRPTPIDLHLKMSEVEFETKLFKYYEHISYKCNHRERMGNVGDGGWDVCLDPPFDMKGPPCLIYSFGINNDWSYDDAISKKRGCTVHAFDPSMSQKDHNRSALIAFHRTGIGAKDGINANKWKIKTLTTLRKELGHDKTTMDMLKMDIEGNEFASLAQSISAGELTNVKQLALELHQRGPKKTTMAGYELLRHLEFAGFRKFHYHANIHCYYKSEFTGIKRSQCHELYYINSNYLL